MPCSNISIHDLAIQKVSARRGEKLHTKGLGKFLRKLEAQFDIDIPRDEWMTRIPDAWSYTPHETDEYPGSLILYEVEDSNPLSVDKLRVYADFFVTYDFYDVDVRLFVYDRYGEQEREIGLAEYYCLLICADHKPISL